VVYQISDSELYGPAYVKKNQSKKLVGNDRGSRTEAVGPREQLKRKLKAVREKLRKQDAKKRKYEEDNAPQTQQQQRQRTGHN
jgi:hypothetical protein